MPKNLSRLRHLFVQYTGGQITPEEESELMRYIAAPEHLEEIDELMAEFWEREPSIDSLKPETAEALLRTVMSSRPPSSWQMVYRYAAAIALVLLAGSAYFYYTSSAPNEMASAQLDMHTVPGSRALVLPDGSTVILKEGSKLEFPRSFNGTSSRSVTLVGEGYFDIVHDSAKPFIVHTGSLQTRVLGTAFVIKAYDDDASITVSVSRGKVQVTDRQQIIGTLTKDQQITFDKERHVAAQQLIKSDSTLAWTRQDIHFDDVTFADATARLSERFNVKVHFANTQASQCRFTATFIEGESFIKVLEVICAFNHATYRQIGPGEFVIDGPGC